MKRLRDPGIARVSILLRSVRVHQFQRISLDYFVGVVIIQEFKKHLLNLSSSTDSQGTPQAPARNRRLRGDNAGRAEALRGENVNNPNGLHQTISLFLTLNKYRFINWYSM